MLNFGKLVGFLIMTKKDALDMTRALTERASKLKDEVDGGSDVL